VKISPHLHQKIRLKNLSVSIILWCLIIALAWLSSRQILQTDITGNATNTLSSSTQQLLEALPDKILITAYIKSSEPIRNQISHLINRYRQYKSDMALEFVDPESEPEKTRELNIAKSGMIVVSYHGRDERISFLDESSLTNALLQLANAKERWVTFLTGHGERSPEGDANFDFKEFSKALARRKINTQKINLAALAAIPDNSALLVLSSTAVPILSAEYDIIRQYVQKGGNLLLLVDPDQSLSILESLGLRQLPGTIVEADSSLYGIKDPSFVVVSVYPQHPISQGFLTTTLYPAASAFEMDDESDFQAQVLLTTSTQSWTETGPLKGEIAFDADSKERQGPLNFAYALTRTVAGKEQQRIVAIGDGDFLSNAYIGNVGNLEMGLRIVNWLIHDDRFINIPAKNAIDSKLELTKTKVAMMGFGFLIVLPGLLMSVGLFIWYKRRQS
jgi:ABC-type uncharacterized transport system involved in gliding motility auxiliary subunit